LTLLTALYAIKVSMEKKKAKQAGHGKKDKERAVEERSDWAVSCKVFFGDEIRYLSFLSPRSVIYPLWM